MEMRVYGVLGIKSVMSNWNADFSGYPKTTSNGEIFGSDKALKYPIKKKWLEDGEKVLYIKTLKLTEGKKGESELVPRSLKERYEHITGETLDKKVTDNKKVLINLFNAIDVKNFGATFAEEGNNISITGAVQIGQGFNKYEESVAEEQQILSPFRDGKDKKNKDGGDAEEAKNSTLGTKIVSNEAHYFYPFSINSNSYNDYESLGVTEGYTEGDYNKFKKTALVSATAYATNAKIGCENEFALFVETEKDVYLPDLAQYIEFIKGDDKDTIKFKAGELLNSCSSKIRNIEIYYNPYTTVIESEIKNAKYYNIFTNEEV